MDQDYTEIIQDCMPIKPWRKDVTRRLPGLQALDIKDWILVDSAFTRQMAYRDHLLDTRYNDVLAFETEAEDAAQEVLSEFLKSLNNITAYKVGNDCALRPDGVEILIDRNDPMRTLGRLVQQDVCILNKVDQEHVLQAATLCFPASWNLAEKIGNPLITIHKPVESYDAKIAKKVQNLFNLMHIDRPLWRANFLIYSNPDLFQPRREDEQRGFCGSQRWVRVERQTLRKMPKTGAVVFGIHTVIVRFENLQKADKLTLHELRNSAFVN